MNTSPATHRRIIHHRARGISAAVAASIMLAILVPMHAAAANDRAIDCGPYRRALSNPADGDHATPSPGWTPFLMAKTTWVVREGDEFRHETVVYRSFCVFEVEPIAGEILDAYLEFAIDRYVTPDASEELVLFDVTTPIPALRAAQTDRADIWADLGDGTVYGRKTVSCRGRVATRCLGWYDELLRVPLNGTFRNLVQAGGTIAIGAALQQYRTARCPHPVPDPIPDHCTDEWIQTRAGPVTLSIRLKSWESDSRIRVGTKGAFVGGGIINTTGFDQSVTGLVAAGRTRTYQVAIRNEGNVVDRFTVLDEHTHPGFRRRFFAGATDVTSQVLDGTYQTPNLDPGEQAVLTLKVTAKSTTEPGLQARTLVTARSVGDPDAVDVVAAFTRSE